jgi:hypothetical protein
MSTITIADFRATIPSMADSARYPDPSVQMWLDNADRLVSAERWGSSFQMGACLFVAHFLTSMALSDSEAAAGGIAGIRAGAITSESGDSVSVSFDASSAMEDSAGHWNATSFGRQYLRFARMFGAGPVQVGAPAVGADLAQTGAWPGFYPLS